MRDPFPISGFHMTCPSKNRRPVQEAAEELAGEPAVRKKGKKKRKDASDFLQHLAAMETEAQPGPSTVDVSGEILSLDILQCTVK